MNEMTNNNRYYLNGYVKPPVVLYSDAEMLIAQNAHNLIWQKYRTEWEVVEKAMKIEFRAISDNEVNPLKAQLIAARKATGENETTIQMQQQLDDIRERRGNLRHAKFAAAFAAIDTKAQIEIDELITAEINTYRGERKNGGCTLQERIDGFESEIASIRQELDELRDTIAGAQCEVDELRDLVQESIDTTNEN